jgi:hypothetical protein
MLYNGVKSAYTARKETPLTNGKKLLKFWEGFNDYARNTAFITHFSLKRPQPKNWYPTYLHVRDLSLSVILDISEDDMHVSVYVQDSDCYDVFYHNREKIEDDLGLALEWWENYICLRRTQSFSDTTAWPSSYQWFIDTAIRFKHTFSSHC